MLAQLVEGVPVQVLVLDSLGLVVEAWVVVGAFVEALRYLVSLPSSTVGRCQA